MYTVFNRYKPSALLFAFCLFFAFCTTKKNNPGSGPVTPRVDAEITINANESKQIIQGFGCATVFNPPNTSALTDIEFDRLFGSGENQIGLNILRIRVAADAAWRKVELDYAKAAIQRGAKILATPWSPPSNMKTNNSLIGGSLKTDSGEAYAKYLNDFANYMSANGAPLVAISVQNEPDIKVSYESCDWTSEEMKIFLRTHGHLVTGTKLMAPESFNNNQNYVDNILFDAIAASNIDIIGGHIYGGGVIENIRAASLNKEVWMTEHLDTNTTYTANLNTAVEIHNCFTKAKFNAYIWWYGKRFYGPIGQDGAITKRGYMMAQFARFVKPGSVRLGTSFNTKPEVYISAYRNATKQIIVAINSGNNDINQKISFKDVTITQVLPYTTTETNSMQKGSAVTITNNSFIFSLPARSITTFVEQ